MNLDLRTIARSLGGDVHGRQVLAPGPGHSAGDRSLSIRLSHQSPTGFIVFSHSHDDFQTSKDYVAAKLGMGPDAWRRREKSRQSGDSTSTRQLAPCHASANLAVASDHAARIARALRIWHEAGDAHGTVVETYLASRDLDLPDGADVLRFHARCSWRDEELDRTIYVPAMIAAMRAIDNDAITAVHRTRLSSEGCKLGRRMLGIAAGAAVKLDANDVVTMGLAIGEGCETALAARQLGFKPCWAVGSAGAIAAFPVLPGVEALTILAENDPANAKAVEACASRWHQADCEVTVVSPIIGNDLNDAIQGAT